MTDLRTEPSFQATLKATEAMIESYAANGVPDAEALLKRAGGWNHLQGHRHSLVPLVVAFLRENRDVLGDIQGGTELTHSMGTGGSTEARAPFWAAVKDRMKAFRAAHGATVIAGEKGTGAPQTVDDISTYLSTGWVGEQSTGGGGDTVIKRTLKLVAHTF